jgi:hypothetical protein
VEKELVVSEHWRLLCDGNIHWVVPTELATSAANARIEAGGCICAPEPGEVGRGLRELADQLEGPNPFNQKGVEGDDAGRKAPAPQKGEAKC